MSRRRQSKPRRRFRRKPKCECGDPTTKRGKPCARCSAIDGRNMLEWQVIRALQEQPTTRRELANAFDVDYVRIMRLMQRMQRDGRVRVTGDNGEAVLYGWRGLQRRCA